MSIQHNSIRLSLLLISLLLATSACSDRKTDNRVDVKRLDLALLTGSLPTDSAMLSAARQLFALSGYGELNDSSLKVYDRNPIIDISRARMDSVWGSESAMTPAFIELEQGLGKMKTNLATLLPGSKFPQIYTVISPFNQSVFTVDSTLFLALNHYLGADFEPYDYFPDYISRRKVPTRVLPDIAEALIRRDYPYSPTEEYPTVSSRLLYEGAVAEAVSQVTGIGMRDVLGYDADEWKWLERNEKEMWQALAERKILFSTDEMTANMLVGLSPSTNILHYESPGYAGRFIGSRIVKSYLKNNPDSISALLTPAFYSNPHTLSLSGY